MKKLPSLTAKQVIKILKRLGFHEDRQKGSHLVLVNSLTKRRTVIPIHSGKTIKKPLLKTIIEKDIGISIEEFVKLL
ncbi:type II toxin-antitoxin system HicA family toxin [bacterium]|nr:type II toxin-antitoxin system HicA family toxin [bacterium]